MQIKNLWGTAFFFLLSTAVYAQEVNQTKISGKDSTKITGLQEVKVYGKTATQVLKEQAFTVNAIDTRQYANTTADLNQILNRSTGIRVREQGGVGSDFNFSINGLSGKSVKYFLDGIPLEVMGSAMSLNNIPVNLAKRVEVFKGVVPVDFGADALGGIVNIVTNQNIGKYLDASYSYGSFNTHRASLSGQFRGDSAGSLIIKASAFYNYSDNNYLMRGVEIWDEKQYDYVKKDFNRFHDQYKSVMGQVEAGVVNKKWADVLFVGVSYSGYQQGLQTGIEQQMVYGDVNRKGNAASASVRYRKNNLFTNGLHVSFFGSRTTDKVEVRDTSFYQYAWDGSRRPTSKAEMGNIKSINHIIRPRTFIRGNVSYEINDHHSLNLNYTFDHLQNKTYNELIIDKDEIPSFLNKQIAGLAYQQTFFDNKLINTFFGKYYGVGIEQSRVLQFDTDGTIIYNRKKESLNYYGYGVASRYKILPELGVKASFEHSYRLQEAEEMFGNGYMTAPNLDLKPEGSDNINIGIFYGKHFGKHSFFTEASWFYRNADDFIYYVPASKRYENKASVKVDGLEGEIRYQYADLLGASVNASYQKSINTTKYSRPGSTSPEITYLNRVPNQPWFFWNADLTIGKNNLLGKGSRLQFNWYTQYVHWFYLSWKAFGNINSNPVIPEQLIHNAILTYSMKEGKYNVGVECRNLTNELAYDNFRLQKPGRSFSIKLRYFIQ
jgi:outer membrane receptor protein involved in Fe transport